PLDPDHPTTRLTHQLTDSNAALLLTTTSTTEDHTGSTTGHTTGHTSGPATERSTRGGVNLAATIGADIPVVVLDDPTTQTLLDRQPVSAPAVDTLDGQAAYLIYTSGSTGRPKSAVITHHNLSHIIDAQRRRFTLTSSDTALQLTSFTFDVAASETFTTLTAGAHLVIADSLTRRSPTHLQHLMQHQRITITQSTPTLLRHLDTTTLPHLRVLITGGEPCPPDLAPTWADGRHLINAYGPTETTICATLTTPTTTFDTTTPPPIGAPLPNTHLHLLDPHLNPVPIGIPGELYITGAGLARGYHHRPALTAERFIANPLDPHGGRLYRTGDLARWRPDGQLDFLGRTDHQIKIRGNRIEPAEIEHTLTTHPAITTALVTEHEQRLIAYLVPADGEIPPVSELREHLRAALPDYMIPTAFVELTAFPLTPNGKIDRAALPAPDGERPALATEFVAPTTPTEELLAGIWADLLNLDHVGVTDNFFDLGGHSLLATQAITRIRAAFGTDTGVAALFDHPTVGELAAVIDTGTAGEAPPPIVPVSRERKLPLSFAQQRLWFLDQLDPGSAEYVIPSPIPLTGDMDIAALRAALDALVERHEVLRTRLVADDDGIPWQVIDPPTRFDLPMVDLTGHDHPQEAARAWVAADAATPFDLATGPLIRATLLRLADDQHILALSMHHIVSDEWSAKIFLRELIALYEASRDGRPNPLPPLAVQYADFAVWQRDWLTGPVLDEQLGYWRNQLADPPVLELPTDRPRPPVRSTAGAAISFHLDSHVTARLRELSRKQSSTLFMTLLAAYTTLLGKYTGQHDVIVGSPVAGRTHGQTEDLIGFFVNTLALRTDLSGDPTFTQLLARVRATALDAYTHQDLPFEQLIDELGVVRDRSRTPLVGTLFNYISQLPDTPAEQAQGDAEVLPDNALFDLSLVMGHTSDGALVGSVQYSTTLFDEPTIRRLIGHLTELLTAVTRDADQPLSTLPVLSAAEQRSLARWNETDLFVPSVTIHELVADQAIAQPGAIAVVCGDASLTYAELDVRANQLAHHLLAAGIGTENVVGLCLDRGPDIIIAILAVWKTGAAYLPLDPDYPTDRLAYMLTDSNTSLLITHTPTTPATHALTTTPGHPATPTLH
ncbi:amino acid adenylation domain-containing protein, partial [Microbispora sp. NPDC046973]|uniref:amino acid adenylation domain-containing protein n=1 Tax=Microbispora sp. NPDC046973 TaxID=3155022 RepID=UPI003409DA9D